MCTRRESKTPENLKWFISKAYVLRLCFTETFVWSSKMKVWLSKTHFHESLKAKVWPCCIFYSKHKSWYKSIENLLFIIFSLIIDLMHLSELCCSATRNQKCFFDKARLEWTLSHMNLLTTCWFVTEKVNLWCHTQWRYWGENSFYKCSRNALFLWNKFGKSRSQRLCQASFWRNSKNVGKHILFFIA